MYDENNIFAKILRGEIPCEKIYEDDNVLFFYDINPMAKVHVLGVPKKPCIDFSDFVKKFDNQTVSNFFKSADKIIEELGIKNSGYKIITNSGKDGGQEVPHFHIHIIGGQKLN
ncbi:HIT domain-containing protein [bacterium]|nr:HIT domain-containing protein [bacterium]